MSNAMNLAQLATISPALADIVDAVLVVWPEHEAFLHRRFRGETPERIAALDPVATAIRAICGASLGGFADGYRRMCGMINDEELHFRRTGGYRLQRFAEVEALIYADPEEMRPYLDGILLSQVLWRNHADAIVLYRAVFLAGSRPGCRHLEIGPGHGLLLALAAADPACGAISGWDVSPTSLARSAQALECLGLAKPVELVTVDIGDPDARPDAGFDNIVLSEVLEHLERPDLALETIRDLLAPGGRAFLNVPVNSPAPDHIYLFETPEAVVEMTAAAGLDVTRVDLLPATGVALDRARRIRATISTVIIATRSP
ncbi:methyltransferase (plasmid) [Tistrella bauzanensis]|nr:methyltransferase [Tistrella bauzanensis]